MREETFYPFSRHVFGIQNTLQDWTYPAHADLYSYDIFNASSKRKTMEKSRIRKIHLVQLHYEVSKFLSFGERFSTSNDSKKFFMDFLVTLLLFKMFSRTRRIQRTLIHNHTMN